MGIKVVHKRKVGSNFVPPDFDVMSGETSSPADGGHIRRGLPPSAALRFSHYHFVSPVHRCKKGDSPLSKKGAISSLVVFLFLIFNSSPGFAQFNVQNPVRVALDELQEKSEQRSQSFVGSRFQVRQQISKLDEVILEKEKRVIEKELRQISKGLEKAKQEIEQTRKQAERYLDTERLRAAKRTQEVRAEEEVGFEYFLEKNFDGTFATVELKDGLPTRITGEAVKNDFGTISRRNRQMTYYGRGKYYRLPKSERIEVFTPAGKGEDAEMIVEIAETVFEEYYGSPQWWGSKHTESYAFPVVITTTSQNSQEPYKVDTVRMTHITPEMDLENGRWRRAGWVEERTTTAEPGIVNKRQVFNVGYDEHDNMNSFFSITWSQEAPLELVFTQYQAEYLPLPDGRHKVDTEKVKRAEVDTTVLLDSKLDEVLSYVTDQDLVPFELVRHTYDVVALDPNWHWNLL